MKVKFRVETSYDYESDTAHVGLRVCVGDISRPIAEVTFAACDWQYDGKLAEKWAADTLADALRELIMRGMDD